ncbi:hypothetical protein [Solibacillus sp. FSL H8-0538]|uniref:hypothetical protein n=1 Tax=Solibacillus sp. FSL H8-0538 TaxID=2921400 RepID=UPI0030F9721D
MPKFVIANIDKVNSAQTFQPHRIGVDETPIDPNAELTYVAQVFFSAGDELDLYVPAEILNEARAKYVYFDLALYPFFAGVKNAVGDQEKSGVVRFRRTGLESKLVGDIYVLSKLFGKPSQTHVKIREIERKAHIIVLLKFGQSIMAHIEFTTGGNERLEFEYSSPQQIIEFDSDEMRPVLPTTKTKLPLMYTVDAITETAVEITDELKQELQAIEQLLGGVVI